MKLADRDRVTKLAAEREYYSALLIRAHNSGFDAGYSLSPGFGGSSFIAVDDPEFRKGMITAINCKILAIDKELISLGVEV